MRLNSVSGPERYRVPSSSGSAASLASALTSPLAQDRLDLRREQDAAVGARPVQRYATPIAGKQQPAPGRVPGSRRRTAAQPLDAGVAPLLVGVDDRFGCRSVCDNRWPAALELLPHRRMVVDLAVEDDLAPNRLRCRAAGGEAMSTMLRRRWPRAADQSTNNPASSGPEWERDVALAVRARRHPHESRRRTQVPRSRTFL